MKPDYNTVVLPVLKASPKILLDEKIISRIREHAYKRTQFKQREYDHMIDHDREEQRLVTGLMGEAACEKLLGMNIIDWSIGDSRNYNHPDIPGFNIGIKTVERGKFPIIYKENYYPQLICVRDTMHPELVCICGIADPDTLNTYQSDDLILNRNLRAKGYKTGFYGFQHLTPVHSIEDLRKYLKR